MVSPEGVDRGDSWVSVCFRRDIESGFYLIARPYKSHRHQPLKVETRFHQAIKRSLFQVLHALERDGYGYFPTVRVILWATLYVNLRIQSEW